MRLVLATLLVAFSLSGAEVAVYNDFSPTVKGMTIGGTHCYMWGKVPVPWDSEIACYINGALKLIQVQVTNHGVQGSFTYPGGSFTWIITQNGALRSFQMTAQPTGGLAIYREGSF